MMMDRTLSQVHEWCIGAGPVPISGSYKRAALPESEFGHQFCEAHSWWVEAFFGVAEEKNAMHKKLQC